MHKNERKSGSRRTFTPDRSTRESMALVLTLRECKRDTDRENVRESPRAHKSRREGMRVAESA